MRFTLFPTLIGFAGGYFLADHWMPRKNEALQRWGLGIVGLIVANVAVNAAPQNQVTITAS